MDLLRQALRDFQQCLDQAKRSSLREPTAMQLSTADAQGRPSARTVLLKSVDIDGFVFYTNKTSRKGRQLAQNPYAALVFYWDAFGRQTLVEGRVEPVSDVESDAYWATRSRQSQIGAWASLQSRSLKSRSLLLARAVAYASKFAGKPVPRPRRWGGYRLVPHRIELWQAKPFRMHERAVYELKAARWTKTLLYP